jgi:hypothetical protein
LTFSMSVLIKVSGLYNKSPSQRHSMNPCMKRFSRHLLGPNDWTTSKTTTISSKINDRPEKCNLNYKSSNYT